MQLALTGNLSAAEQRFDPQQKLLLVDWLDHIVVCSNQKALALFLRELLGSHH